MIKRKIIQVICLVIMLCGIITLSGCTEEYDRADIIKYVTQNCDIKKFSVSKDYEEVEGDDGYTDKVWTVTVNGDDKLEFVVHDDFHWGMESLTNSLNDDYKYVECCEMQMREGNLIKWNNIIELLKSYTENRTIKIN